MMVSLRAHWVWCVALILCALAPYVNSFDSSVVFDAELVIVKDPRVHELTIANLKEIARKAYYYPDRDNKLYRPLVTLTYLTNYAILRNGSNTFGYHCVNFGFHLINILLLYFIGTLVFRQRSLAFFAAAVFAVHPAGTEAVTNVTGRPDLMAAMAVLGSLVVFTRIERFRGYAGFAALASLFVLAFGGMLSKESAIVMLPLALLYDIAFRRERLKNWKESRLAYWAIAYGIVAAWALRHRVLSHLQALETPFVDNPLLGAPFLAARLTALEVITKYLKLMAWPSVLSCDYSYGQVQMGTLAGGLAALALLLILFGLLVYAYARDRRVFFYGLACLIALFPASNLLLQIGSVMGERFLYLPLAGYCGCVIALLHTLCNRMEERRASVAMAAAVTVLLAALGVRTFVRNADWDSNETLFTAAMKSSPGSFKPYHVLASEIWRKGDAEQLAKGIELAKNAVHILDQLPPEKNTSAPYSVLGGLWRMQGDKVNVLEPDAAKDAYRQAVDAYQRGAAVDKAYNEKLRKRDILRGVPAGEIPDRGFATLWVGLGTAQSRLGHHPEALEAKLYAARIYPTDPEIMGQVSEQMYLMNRTDEALQWAAKAMLVGRTTNTLQRFVAYYREAYPNECSPTVGSGMEELNVACAPVRKLVCAGEQGLIQALRNAHTANLIAWYADNRSTKGMCPMD